MRLDLAYFAHSGHYLIGPPIAAYEAEAEYLRQIGRHAEARAFERTARRIRWARQMRLTRMQRRAA